MIKELTREQKKIIYIAVVVAAFIILFWAVVYAPQSRRLTAVKNKLSAAEAQIAQITRLAQNRDLGQVVTDLSKQLNQMAAKLPAREEGVLNYLSKTARDLKIEIKDMDLADKKTLEGKIPGYVVAELPVVLSLSAEFRSLGEYLNVLEDNSSILVQVRQLEIKGSGEGHPKLDINLKLLVYLSQSAAEK